MSHQTEEYNTIINKSIVIQPRLFACSLDQLADVASDLQFSPQNYSSSRPHWLVFNFCDEPSPYETNSQHIHCGWETTIPGCPIPTLPHTLRVIQGICSWLKLSPHNNLIMVCADGRARCSIVAAIFLRYPYVFHCLLLLD